MLLCPTAGASGEITFGSLSYGVRDLATGAIIQPVPSI